MQNINPDEEVHIDNPQWGGADNRNLLINFLGGLAANIALAMMIGLVFAIARLSSLHGAIYATFYYIAWFAISAIAAAIAGILERTFMSRSSHRRASSHWRSWFLYAGIMAFVFYFGYAIQISK